MLTKRFKGTVTIAAAMGGPRLIQWRWDKRKTSHYATSATFVPYDLAMYLCLIPMDGSFCGFKNKLYGISNKELYDLKPDSIIKRVSKLSATRFVLTIDLTKGF